MKRIICLIWILGWMGSSYSQKILLVNGHLHPVEGQEITSSLIEIENGKIIAIKNALSNSYNAKDWDTIIDATNQHVYPGFVAANRTHGLAEIDTVRATNDYELFREFNTHIRSPLPFNDEFNALETVRTHEKVIV